MLTIKLFSLSPPNHHDLPHICLQSLIVSFLLSLKSHFYYYVFLGLFEWFDSINQSFPFLNTNHLNLHPFIRTPPSLHSALWLAEQAGQAFLAFQRYKLGADSALFSQDYTDPSEDAAATVPYSSYSAGDDLESPGGTGSYQQSTEGVYDGSAGYQRQEYWTGVRGHRVEEHQFHKQHMLLAAFQMWLKDKLWSTI